MKKSPALVSAIVLAAAVTLQAGLGVWTLLAVAPIDLALAHQAMAMLVLMAATINAAGVAERMPRAVAPAVRA